MGHPVYEVKTAEGVTVDMRLSAEHAKKLGGKRVDEKKRAAAANKRASAPANKQAGTPDDKGASDDGSQGEGAS